MENQEIEKYSVEWYKEKYFCKNSVRAAVEIVTEEVSKGLAAAAERAKESGLEMRCTVNVCLEGDTFTPLSSSTNGTRLKIEGIAIKVGQ